MPVGALAPGSFADDAGDTAAAAFVPAFDQASPWAVRADDAGGGLWTFKAVRRIAHP